jgi:hypothetical protein
MDITLRTQLLFTVEVEVAAPIELGEVGPGSRRCIPLLGGRFHGAIEGEVVPGGADWQTIASAERLEIAAHYVLRTREGALIEVESSGVRQGSPAVLARLARAEPVEPSEYYFRTQMRFRTSAPALARLNSVLAISIGERLPKQVRLRVYEVL